MPLAKERLTYADGSVIFGAVETPFSESSRTERASAISVSEGAAAMSDIDRFEKLIPTLPGDEEERAAEAAANRAIALQKVVPLIDVSGDGIIIRTEIMQTLPTDDSRLSAICHDLDLDAKDSVRVGDWLAEVLARHAGLDETGFVSDVEYLKDALEAPLKAAAARTFAEADGNSSGTLDIFEVTAILYKLSHPDDVLKLDAVMKEFDTNGDNELDSIEFQQLVSCVPACMLAACISAPEVRPEMISAVRLACRLQFIKLVALKIVARPTA